MPSPPEINARLVTTRAGAVLDAVAAACVEIDCPMRDDRPARLSLDTGIGQVFYAAAPGELRVHIAATSPANAFMLRESVVARVEAVDPGFVAGLRWSDALPATARPPNFRAGRVTVIERPCPSFTRLEVAADDLGAFARDGLHLRLALPPRGRAPVWPGLDPAGRTLWPRGADALHLAVYTIRRIDPEAGTLTVEAFRHGRGPTCDWLDAARPGDPLGLVGPGGGWLPPGRHLTLAGDETALPAIARILESAGPGTTGTALVETAAAEPGLPIAAPPRGIALRVLSRARGERLEAAMDDLDLGATPERHVWFAAEKARAAAMRRDLRERRGLSRGETTISGYWVDR